MPAPAIAAIIVVIISGFLVFKNLPINQPEPTVDKGFQGSMNAQLANPSPSPSQTAKAKSQAKPSSSPASSATTNSSTNPSSSSNPTSNTSNNSTSSNNTSNTASSTPTPTPTPSPSVSSDPISISATSVNNTLKRSVSYFGQGITITNNTTSTIGINIQIKSGQNGVGLRPMSTAILPGGYLVVESFIDSTKPNGVYTGENLIKYSIGGSQTDGPTIPYTITLEN